MPTSVKLLGYAGFADISGTNVLMTSGSFSESYNPSYLEMISTPPTSTQAGRVQHADGTIGYTGSVGFDVHAGAMGIISSLLQRNVDFYVDMDDGTSHWRMTNCRINTLNLAGSVGGLITADLSFMSATAKVLGSSSGIFMQDTEPAGYWYSGIGSYNVMSWNFSMSQEADFVYRNRASSTNDGEYPGYIKIGNVTYVLTVSLFEEYAPTTTNAGISIVTSDFTLTGRKTGKGFSYGGVTGIGSYTYTFETSSQTGKSDGVVLS